MMFNAQPEEPPSGPHSHEIGFDYPLRDAEFLLWEYLGLQDDPMFKKRSSRTEADDMLARSKTFAESILAPLRRTADENESYLDAKGKVVIPAAHKVLFDKYRSEWSDLLRMQYENPNASSRCVQYLCMEMQMGANAALMANIGFNGPGLRLLKRYGSPELNAEFAPPLYRLDATATLCITEKQAGSDLSQLACRACKLEGPFYHITGHKWLISGAVHDLSDNIFHFVLARTGERSQGMFGLSCFLVPRFLLDRDGRPTIDNGVECSEIVQKMGFRALPNGHLIFGRGKECRGYMIGEHEGRGLLQLLEMLTPGRISTGIFALGLAGDSYRRAARYSQIRVQGKPFDLTISTKRASLPIAHHLDVQRMLKDMRADIEGSRALIVKMGYWQDFCDQPNISGAQKRSAEFLVDLLTPVIKAYISDQAWIITGLAIQVFGGVGFLRSAGVEQNARDCRIFSIWEGTNHIHSQQLVRDRLNMGLNLERFAVLEKLIQDTIDRTTKIERLAQASHELSRCLNSTRSVLLGFAQLARLGCVNSLPGYSSDFLKVLAEVIIGWLLLDMAASCGAHGELPTGRNHFYLQKIETAAHFGARRLPLTKALAEVVTSAIANELAHAEPHQPSIYGSTPRNIAPPQNTAHHTD